MQDLFPLLFLDPVSEDPILVGFRHPDEETRFEWKRSRVARFISSEQRIRDSIDPSLSWVFLGLT
jgi:hypothetical protein